MGKGKDEKIIVKFVTNLSQLTRLYCIHLFKKWKGRESSDSPICIDFIKLVLVSELSLSADCLFQASYLFLENQSLKKLEENLRDVQV